MRTTQESRKRWLEQVDETMDTTDDVAILLLKGMIRNLILDIEELVEEKANARK